MGALFIDLHREYLRQMRTGEVRDFKDVPTEEYDPVLGRLVPSEGEYEYELDSLESSASSYGMTARESAERAAEVETREVGR